MAAAGADTDAVVVATETIRGESDARAVLGDDVGDVGLFKFSDELIVEI